MSEPQTTSSKKDATYSENGFMLTPPVVVDDWAAFVLWAEDAGYDESYFNLWDSKCLDLQDAYNTELAEENAAVDAALYAGPKAHGQNA